MQVRNWGADNRLATSANDIQSTIDIVYSSVRDSVRGNAHALSAHKNDRARIAGWGKEGARGRMLARGSQDGSRLLRVKQVVIFVVVLIRG